jgi:hypothetical protein
VSKIFVIAGRYDQYRLFRRQLMQAMIEEDIEFWLHDIVYVSGAEMLRGFRCPWGYRVGTWAARPDLADVEMGVKMCGSSFDDFIEVEL